jgi:signal transduction histidine kinase
MSFRRFLIQCTYLILFIPCKLLGEQAIDTNAIKINDAPDYPIGEHISFWRDEGNGGIDVALQKFRNGSFTPLGHPTLFNKGYTESIWWFAFQIKNEIDSKNTVIFSPAGAAIREGTLYTFDEKGVLLDTAYSGFIHAGQSRDMHSRLNSYELILPAGAGYTYLFKLDSRGLNTYVPFYLDEPNSYWEFEISRTAFFGTVTGVLMMAVFFALFLWGYFNEKIYIIFVGYILSCLALILEEDGFLFLWIYGDQLGRFSSIIIPFFSLMMSGMLVIFIIRFFNLKDENRRLFTNSYHYIKAVFVFGILVFSTLFFDWNPKLNLLLTGMGLTVSFTNMLLVILITLSQIRTKKEIAYYILLANLMLIFGFSNYILNLMAVTDWHPLKPNGLIVGSIFNVILLTIGIIHRYYFMKKEKEVMDRQFVEQERNIARSIIEAQERERQRIAKDLHDDLGGLLALIKLKVDSLLLEATALQNESKTGLAETHKLLEMACHDLRFISHELMPMEAAEKRLKTMVSEVLDLVKIQNKISITYNIEDLPYLPLDTKINLFRIIKELLNNIIKHAEAKEADIQLFFDEMDETVTLMVSDDGKGISKEVLENPSQGIGLRNLQKRVDYLRGKLHFDSNINGTTVIVTIPFQSITQKNEYTDNYSR